MNEVRDYCKLVWSLGKFLTIDEMMIRYKGSYCPARQYMPKKPQKWCIKVWCLADSSSKFVYYFDIYCGKNHNDVEVATVERGEPKLAHGVVLKLVEGLENKGHVVVTNNYFSSVGLFVDLLKLGIYATGTMRCNRVGLPLEFKNLKPFNKRPQGTLSWSMHESRSFCSIVWTDKQVVLLLSTHAMPIAFPCTPVPTVPRRNGADVERIQTSPVHVEYTTHMRGVDVADQLRASYSCQTRSHKWWHRVFYFLLDTTVVNMYILYLGIAKQNNPSKIPISHLQFKTNFWNALLVGWQGHWPIGDLQGPEAHKVHLPKWTKLRRNCVVCHETRCHYHCPLCNRKFMCINKGCFEKYHNTNSDRNGRVRRGRRQ